MYIATILFIIQLMKCIKLFLNIYICNRKYISILWENLCPGAEINVIKVRNYVRHMPIHIKLLPRRMSYRIV